MSLPENNEFSIFPVLTHIQAHVDSDLRLETLARRFGLSPWHFHRLFQASTGETLKQYTLRLRLERSAMEMLLHRTPLLQIALTAGFNNHETFTRAFKRWSGSTPSLYRETWRRANEMRDVEEAGVPDVDASSFEISETRVVEFQQTHVAFIRHTGAYENVPESLWSELEWWAQRRGLQRPPLFLGIAHDAPGITPPEKLRFDAALAVPAPFSSGRRVGCQVLPAMTAAVTKHVGSFATLAHAYRAAVDRIKAMRRVKLIGLPAIEHYQTKQVKSLGIHHTDIYLPVKRSR